MSLPVALVLLGHASILIELLVFAVPSVASTLQARRAAQRGRWLALHLLPTTLAVGGFLWPCVATAWRAFAPTTAPSTLTLPGTGAFAACCAVSGRVLTLTAVAALRAPRTGEFTAAGPYRWSRNPALLGLHLLSLGAVALAPAWHTLLGWATYVAHMHRRVRAEERHLTAHAGAAYVEYCARVPRYIPSFIR